MDITMKRGMELFNLGKYSQALQHFFSLGAEPSDNPDLSYYIGLCYARQEEYDDALLYLEQVVTNHDNILLVYQTRMLLGYIYTITGRLKLAEFEFKKLLEEGYESPQVYAALGSIAFDSKDTERSLEYLRKARELDPENVNAVNSLGYILADSGEDVQNAVDLCKKAVEKNPENPAYLDSLGWAYFRLGQRDEAVSYLRRALKKSGGNKIIANHLRQVIDKDT